MALINCKECGAEVSDKALDCPKCGAKLRKPQRTFFGKLVKYSFIGFNANVDDIWSRWCSFNH
jgi:DNA-directed RNA polymerase subunit RPC12/RpoP